MLSLLTYFLFLLIFYSYFGYPLILKILPKRRVQFEEQGTLAPSFTVVVAARNEEAVIERRLENILKVERPGSVQILVCSDASDDGTDDIVRSFADRGIHLVRSPERRGKEYAQSLAVAQATGDIIVFTDAKVRTEPTLLKNLIPYFQDSRVGAVSSIDRVEGEGSGEGMYVRYEMWLRRLESRYSTLVGLSGSCFAVRSEIAKNLRTDIPSDFALLLETVRTGKSGVLAEDVVCTYTAVKTEEQEFSRKVRTVLRGITALLAVPEVLDYKKYGSFTWQIVSHKLGRWFVPWMLLIATLASFQLAPSYLFWAFVSVGLTLFYAAAIFAYYIPELRKQIGFKVPLYFMTTNLAIAAAWLRYWKGERSVAWDPSKKA